MNKSIEKDKKKREMFLKYEKDRKVLKSICHNTNLPNNIRKEASLDLSALPKDSSIVRLRNRCIMTGRGRFIFTSFNLSRLMLRKLAHKGLVPGLTKSSW